MNKFPSVKLAHLVKFCHGQDWKSVEAPDGAFPVYGSGGKFGLASDFLHDGEAVLFGRKGTVDRPIYVNGKFWSVDTMYYAVPHRDKCIGKYLYYWATTIPFKTITTNTALPSVTSMDLSQLYVPLPSLETQQRISDYLDRETAEIDAAVADLGRYVELLEKRRLAVIEENLNLSSYQMCPVGLISKVTLGKMVTSEHSSSVGTVRNYLRAAHVQPWGRLDFTVPQKTMPFTDSESIRLDLRAGDVVVVEGGAGFGRSGFLEEDLENWGFQNSINRVRMKNGMADGRFVNFMLIRALINGSIGMAVDTATLPHFTAEKLSRFRIPLCSLEQQIHFVKKVSAELNEIDSLVAESTKLRELLLKRRSVLITDVVTGRKQV